MIWCDTVTDQTIWGGKSLIKIDSDVVLNAEQRLRGIKTARAATDDRDS